MEFQSIFNEYYTLYRGDSDIPGKSDPEWAIGVRYANTALRRMNNVDGETWDFLWTTTDVEGETLVYETTSTIPVVTTYDCPTNMSKPGGLIKFTDPNNSSNFFEIDVLGNHLVQTRRGSAPFAWFTGNTNTGYVLSISMSGNSFEGYNIDFPYYKTPTYFDATAGTNGGVAEDGTTITECPDANFIVNYMLAYRYRSSRNYPSYQIAKADAETDLQGMQIKNRVGVDGHPWNLIDSSGGAFGQ